MPDVRTETRLKENGEVTETATEVRQATLGKPVLAVLIGGLFLALIAWGAVEMWGESIALRPTLSSMKGPVDPPPSITGAFDNNPAGGGSRPPEAIDRSLSPSGSGGAPRVSTAPSGSD